MTTWADGMKSDELPEFLMRGGDAPHAGAVVEVTTLPEESLQETCERLNPAPSVRPMAASNLDKVQNLLRRRDFLQRQADVTSEPYITWKAQHSKPNDEWVEIPNDMMTKYLSGLLADNATQLEALGVDPWS